MKIIVIFFLSFCLSSCGTHEDKKKDFDPKRYTEPLIEANKRLVKTEEEQINDLIKRYRWNMKETGSGLRYIVYEKGKGKKAEKNTLAKIEYTVNLINGDLVYSSDETGPKEFLIGKGGVESGLEEGILFLKEGDRAKFIIPSHLAYGLLGDQKKIPPKATLIYDVKILEIKFINK